MHRRENHENINKWFTEINKLAIQYSNLEFIFPLHPNPNVQKFKHLLSNVTVIEPLTHTDLVELLVKTKLVITDSGGIQEECSFFNKKCLVCREVTERPESVGLTSFMVTKPNELGRVFKKYVENYKVDAISPFGDGYSSKKIINIFKRLIA
jgi:UDP-N-acetylglucosamine 2-epimerase (non-hydrolysing)